MRHDVSFTSFGETCRGWLYRPDGPTTLRPAIVMSHGLSAVKEQRLHPFAERFAHEGFVVLVFDYRHLGASDGDPRGRIAPQLQHDDIRAALSFLVDQPGVDAKRIALWGTSYSGGHALHVGALDPRVAAVLVQAPAIAIAQAVRAMSGAEGFSTLLAALAGDHALRNAGGEGQRLPITAADGGPSFLPGREAHDWFTGTARQAPSWLNSTTLESIARGLDYTPGALIELISPRPLLIQAAADDSIIPLAHIQDAFARAGEPKTLQVLQCGHFDLYQGPFHDQALEGQVAWLRTNLRP